MTDPHAYGVPPYPDKRVFNDLRYSDFNMFDRNPRSAPEERQAKIALMIEMMVQHSGRMDPQLAERLYDIVDRPLQMRDIMHLKQLMGNGQINYKGMTGDPVFYHVPEEHIAECCTHRCKFKESSCPITNGTATADMPCEGDHV